MYRIFMLLLPLLAACAAVPPAEVGMSRTGDSFDGQPLPAMQAFAGAPGDPVQRSNGEIAADFVELAFELESGRPLQRLTRFDGPITLRLTGDVPVIASAELGRVLRRLQAEAGLQIQPVSTPDAALTVQFAPRSVLRKVVADAICFVVPNVTSLREYKALRGTPAVDWANLTQRTHAAIFVPSDTTPQEVRDCLHEELAQALGPLNDLHRLQDSVFNDDNFNTVLTGFDMLVLKAYYDRDLQSGMTRAEVARRLPAILARLNPAGERPAARQASRTPAAWTEATKLALGQNASAAARRTAAERMLSIAAAQGWTDNRLGLSHFALGRALIDTDPRAALTHFTEAGRIFRSLPGGELHAAHVDMQLAAIALASGAQGASLAYADRAIPVARHGENATLLATLLLIRSEALAATGRTDEAVQARLDSLGWARYGFGSQAQIRARMSEIAALAKDGTTG